MKSNSIPVLPLRDIVVFPHMVAPLFVGRTASINALNQVMLKDQKIDKQTLEEMMDRYNNVIKQISIGTKQNR